MTDSSPAARARRAQAFGARIDADGADPILPCRRHWIEVQLLDAEGRPAAGEVYRIVDPDGVTHEGALDGNGIVRLTDLSPGVCQIGFPARDRAVWGPLATGA